MMQDSTKITTKFKREKQNFEAEKKKLQELKIKLAEYTLEEKLKNSDSIKNKIVSIIKEIENQNKKVEEINSKINEMGYQMYSPIIGLLIENDISIDAAKMMIDLLLYIGEPAKKPKYKLKILFKNLKDCITENLEKNIY